MMRSRLARWPRWGAACVLVLTPVAALAQSGQPAVGPRVTDPETNRLAPGSGANAPSVALPPRDVLPPVPATRSDPAPPGTRAVRVDSRVPLEGPSAGDPGSAEPVPAVGTRMVRPVPTATVAPAAAPVPRIGPGYVEGVITDIRRAEGTPVQDALMVVTVDPARTWEDFIRTTGGATPATPEATAVAAERAAEAAERAAQAAERAANAAARRRTTSAPDEPQPNPADPARPATNPPTSTGNNGDSVLSQAFDSVGRPAGARQDDIDAAPGTTRPVSVIVSRQTTIGGYRRSPEGVDTYVAPVVVEPIAADPVLRADVPDDAVVPTRALPADAGLRVGSYVAVRYRTVNDANRALNIGVISPAGTTPGAVVVPGAVPTTGTPAARAAAVTAPEPGLDPVTAPPQRVKVVPVPDGRDAVVPTPVGAPDDALRPSGSVRTRVPRVPTDPGGNPGSFTPN